MATLTVALAQFNPIVGDIDGNVKQIIRYAKQATQSHKLDLLIFPELAITGYPPEDLLLRPSLDRRVGRALQTIQALEWPFPMIVGYPKVIDGCLYNMAGVIDNGSLVFEYAKQSLPNYQVFDERRYFTAGDKNGVWEHKGLRIGVTICEDLWDGRPVAALNNENIDVLINLSASPFHENKHIERVALLADHARQLGSPICYANLVGGQDELVFDGGSMVVDAQGACQVNAPVFESALLIARIDTVSGQVLPSTANGESPVIPDNTDWLMYKALVIGVRDYVEKNGFNGVVLGLSGGIDSALTLAIAVDALGAARVQAVMMPFRYTSELSQNDAAEQAKMLGVTYHSVGIESIYGAFTEALAPIFKGAKKDTTEENIQARSRGVLLMAISNKLGYLVLTTGNKSEMAVGYATLYGDMAGGFDVLKDVAKTRVFRLSRFRNTLSPAIPESVITRPPSAELAPDQKDEDSLPPYDVLDQILALYVEQDVSAEAIVAQGFDKDTVYRVLRLVDVNEYKRRQAAIGVRLTRRGFGRDRRYPITNGWKLGD